MVRALQSSDKIGVFIAALFIKAPNWGQSKCPPVDDCINKMWYIPPVEYYYGNKRKY